MPSRPQPRSDPGHLRHLRVDGTHAQKRMLACMARHCGPRHAVKPPCARRLVSYFRSHSLQMQQMLAALLWRRVWMRHVQLPRVLGRSPTHRRMSSLDDTCAPTTVLQSCYHGMGLSILCYRHRRDCVRFPQRVLATDSHKHRYAHALTHMRYFNAQTPVQT